MGGGDVLLSVFQRCPYVLETGLVTAE